MPRNQRATLSGQIMLLHLLLTCFFIAVTSQEGTIISLEDELSYLAPTNLIYKTQDQNIFNGGINKSSSGDSLEEGDIIGASQSNVKNSRKEELLRNVVKYEDENNPEEESFSNVNNSTIKRERSPIEDSTSNTDVGDVLRDEDYLEDSSANQYDNSFYYYDEYENENRSRHDAVNNDNVEYPDTEHKEETIAPVISSGYNIPERKNNSTLHTLSSNRTSTQVTLKEQVVNATPVPNLEHTLSMENSNKMFSFLGAPEIDNTSDSSVLIGEVVVSVVTTKSVVNGTISVPTTSPITTEQVMSPPSLLFIGTTDSPVLETITEDSSKILASVQTSRSISGARFLPFPAIDRIGHSNSLATKRSSLPSESTESIIDKLDWAQSKLSSDLLPAAILGGGFKNTGNTLQLDILAEKERATHRKFTTTVKTPVISRFVPQRYKDRRSDQENTTIKSQSQTVINNLENLLPRNYTLNETISSDSPFKTNFRLPSPKQITSKETIRPITSITPPTKSKSSIFVQDISALLPSNYKLKKEDTAITGSSILNDILAKSKTNISSLLPSDYNEKKVEKDFKQESTTLITTTIATTINTIEAAKNTNISEKIASSIQDLFLTSKFDISALLPKDYEQKKKNLIPDIKVNDINIKVNATTTERNISDFSTTKKPDGIKIVFPSRPGGRKSAHKITTLPTPRGDRPAAEKPKIQKGWPTRATTEFTGWPTPSTTPISIQKLLEAARTATVESLNILIIPSTNTIPNTLPTSTSMMTPVSTTPGLCNDECEVAGTLRIIGNATWVPELFDRNTYEWQKLANEVEREINLAFSKSVILTSWYKNIRIDSFSRGSILVDYFVELVNLQQTVNTQELKTIFHDSLRTYNANQWNETNTKGSLKMGIFTIDPKYTDFVVMPKISIPQYIEKDDRLIPQWAIAVIVIGIGGLLFIIVFGVSILVNRRNQSQLKPTIPTLCEEELNKHTSSNRSSDYSKPVHTIWTEPVTWNDKAFESTSNKILVDRLPQDNKKYNLYDSWRSEWNGYYYNPSHTNSKYDYDNTNLSSHQHPDYDTNF